MLQLPESTNTVTSSLLPIRFYLWKRAAKKGVAETLLFQFTTPIFNINHKHCFGKNAASELHLFFMSISFVVNVQLETANCPRNWVEERDICYKFTRTPTKNRREAFEKCRDYGAELVSVNSEVEHHFIVNWLRNNDPQHRHWYTSASNKGNVWFWDGDGSQFINIANLWLPNAASMGSNYEDAAYVYSEKAKHWGLQSLDGFEKLPYVCEIPKEKLDQIIVEERGPDYGIIVDDEKLIPRAPKFVKEPVDAIFDTSSRNQVNFIKLRCVADGYPYPEYKWFKEEFDEDRLVDRIIEPLDDARLTQTDGTLNVYDPQQEDLGTYHCLAQNKFGTAVSTSVQLSFGFIAEFSKARSTETGRAYWGKALFCDPPNHYPAIQYNWAREQFPRFIQVGKRVFVSMDGNLYFTSLEKNDEALYSCNVQSVISSTGRTGPFFKLAVTTFSSSQVLQFPNNFPKAFPEVPLSGQDVKLECVAFGYPVPSYNWTRKGANTNLPPRASLQNYNRVLVLPKISIEDTGEYVCTAANGQAAIQSSVSIDIRANPVFTIPLEDQHVDAGSDFTWMCEAFGIPEVKYKWLKNGKDLKISALPLQDRNRYKIDQNMLTIKFLEKNRDEGVYQCKAYNSLASSYSSGHLRILSFKPTFKKYPLDEEIYAVEGGNITIPCRPEGAPNPDYVWRRNGNIIGGGGDVKILNNGYLVINPVGNNDEGTYSCTAKNDLGQDTSSGLLIVLQRPRVTEIPRPAIRAVVNDTVQLRCEARDPDNNIEMTYVWYQNNLPISPKRNPFIQQGDYPGYLRIHNVSFSHDGDYMCLIKTPLMNIAKSSKVVVYGPPGRPGGVIAADTTQDSATIYWTNGAEYGATIVGYIIEGETNHNSTWIKLAENITARQKQPGEQIYSEIRGVLSPYSLYRFRVSAINEYGIGPASLPSPQYNTRSGPPRKFPRNIGGGGGKIGDLTIRWTPLPPGDWNARSIWYNVYWKLNSPKEQFAKNGLKHLGNAGMFVVSVGAEKFYTEYVIKVQAINEEGEGPISPEVIIFSAENREFPDVKPSGVIARAFNSTAMNVSWTPVDASRETIRGTLVGHRIKYWEGNDVNVMRYPERAEVLLVRGTTSWGMVVGLNPNKWYVMTVSVYNNAGSGTMSPPTVYRTFKKAPSQAPTSVKVKALSKTSVFVTWRYVIPALDEEPIIGYKVKYRMLHQDISEANTVFIYKGQKTLEAEVTDLIPGEMYILRLLAYSQGGDGRMSSPSIEFRMGRLWNIICILIIQHVIIIIFALFLLTVSTVYTGV
ncbi:Contactin [Nymphon striatum]|nr:Contactin [Nymphon striatum]